MADTPERKGGPPAVDQTGNLTIWVIPGTAEENGIDLDAIQLSDLDSPNCQRITYSFITGGWGITIPQEKDEDERLTSPQRKQALGKQNPEMSDLTYVVSSDPDSASVILEDGGPHVFIERRGTAQTEVAAAGQVVRGIETSLGVQAPGPVTGSGKFTETQAVVVEYVSPKHALTA